MKAREDYIQLPPDEDRCTAVSKQRKKRCKQWVVPGLTVCGYHGGSNHYAVQKSQRILKEEGALEAMKNLGFDPSQEAKPVNPIDALLGLVSDKAREVAWLRHMVDTLEHAVEADSKSPLVWGVESHEEGTGQDGYINKTVEKAGLNTWIRWLHLAEDQLARYSATALKAGVEAKYVEIKQQEATQLVSIIDTILSKMQLNDHQQQMIPTVVPEVLRRMQPDNN